MPGVELGDLGMKMAYNATCNGYGRFSGVRVPRGSLLAAHAEVDGDGMYRVVDSGGENLAKKLYATMLDMRCIIVRGAGMGLAQTVTVATRYSVVREQGRPMFAAEDSAEVSLVAYKSQQYRLGMLIAQAYAVVFASKAFDAEYRQFEAERAVGDYARLGFIHGLSTGLKAWATTVASAGAEEARKMCGGHGYLAISGLPDMVATVAATATFEGDNYVMWQQLVRYLFKQIKTQPVDADIAEYMGGLTAYLEKDGGRWSLEGGVCELATLQSIFRHRSMRLLALAFEVLSKESETSSPGEAWNKHMMSVLSAGHAFVEYYVLRTFAEYVDGVRDTDSNLAATLRRLCRLFALTTVVSPVSTFYAVSFTEDGTLNVAHLTQMRETINELLLQLLPDLVALTDAWDFTDASLSSALGCKDGNVYERLMVWTKQLPVNNGSLVAEAWGGDEGVGGFLRRNNNIRQSKV
ncbi:hypothetical protein FE257_003095 [Aspergillus nanangensis]|uniref:Acyl-CoA oxidase C-terminal domain-containing protein n=1 Tax=Aspergillus nanangensis TaxID=2582783 RepID=A0AAD4GNR8_ASPNN|nr:hypothetical protein FE257_003095 [Aspergillus nanangensis]